MTCRAPTVLLVLSIALNAYLFAELYKSRTPDTTSPEESAAPQESASAEAGNATPAGIPLPFIRVVDGDTVIVGIEGKSEYVRLIGINAPEPNVSGEPECYASESTAHAIQILSTGTVILRTDESQAARDTYGRILAYVELPDGTDVGKEMVRAGYAREFTYDKSYTRRDEYRAAEAEAIQTNAGLWSPEGCGTKTSE